MSILIRFILLPALFGACCLIGCTPGDSVPTGTTPTDHSDAQTVDAASAADDPCNLLTDAEVRQVFSGAASGKRDHSVDKYGILSCVWEAPIDRLIVQAFDAKPDTLAGELRSRVQGFVDPMMAGAADRIRYETIAGVGDQAIAVVEKADPEHGILADMAQLVTRRGERGVILFTGASLANGDRASALSELEKLGRSAVKRL